jgi:hypothetical protein
LPNLINGIPIPVKGWAKNTERPTDKEKFTDFNIDARSLGMYASMYKTCLPCGTC